MPALQSNCIFTNVPNIIVSNQWQNLGCRLVLFLIFTTSNVFKKATISKVSQKIVATLPCKNDVHTASFTFFLFLFTISCIYLTYTSFCVSK